MEIIGSDDCENYFKYYKAALGGYDKEEDKKFEEKIIKNGSIINFTQDAVVVSELLDLIISEGKANRAKQGKQ